MARIDINTDKLTLLIEIDKLRYKLSQYKILLGIEPFDRELLRGERGYKGDKGKAFYYSDFTPEQIKELQRPAADMIAELTVLQGELNRVEALRQQTEELRVQQNQEAILNVIEAKNLAIEVAEHPPVIVNDVWHRWNFITHTYETTGNKAIGDSAYQVWLEAGNTGTVEDYLADIKGEPFTYDDFTPAQLEALKVKGEPFLYEDFTPEQIEALKVKGETPKYMEEILWANLIELMNNNQLIPGAKYLITDYQTVHTIPNTEDTNTGEVEPLLVTAISSNELAPEAYSALFPDDVIYYSPTNDQAMVPGCTKGYIYRRIDTKQNNDIPFDFRQVKFRRWQISQPAWDAATTYAKGAVVKATADNTLWVSLQDGNINNVTSDTAYWRQFEWNNLSYVSPVENEWYIIDAEFQVTLTCTALYQDYKMWANAADYNFAYSNKLEGNPNNLIYSSNTVIFGSGFNNNSIGSGFRSNSIGSNFSYNSIKSGFNGNSIGSGFNGNSIGSNCGFNSIGSGFGSNSIGAYFSNNSIGAGFNRNSIGIGFFNNSIGAYFSNNSIGAGFSNNSIGAGFSNNSIGIGFFNNSIGSDFSSNSIGIGLGMRDLSLVTELYEKAYQHELIATDGEGLLIRWYNSSGVQQTLFVP